MKFVHAAFDAALVLVGAAFLGDFATDLLNQADDVSNIAGLFLILVGGAALLVFSISRVKAYVNNG